MDRWRWMEMGGWVGGWMDGWMEGSGFVGRWMDGWMERVDGCMDGWMEVGLWVGGWMDGWMNGWMDGWMDGHGWGGWGRRMDGWMEGWNTQLECFPMRCFWAMDDGLQPILFACFMCIALTLLSRLQAGDGDELISTHIRHHNRHSICLICRKGRSLLFFLWASDELISTHIRNHKKAFYLFALW